MKKLLILLAVLFASSAFGATTNSLDGAVALVTQGGTGGTTGARQLLTATTNFYVTTTGSDSTGTGTSGNPWLTINHALSVVQSTYDLGNQTVNINVADGTYTTGVTFSAPFVGGTPNIVGDVATPASCIISSTSASAFNFTNGVRVNISGFKVTTTTSGSGVSASGSGTVVTINGAMNIGTAAN